MKTSNLLLIYPSRLYAPHWGEISAIKAHMIDLFSFLKYKKIGVEVLDLENEIGRPKTEEQVKEFEEKTTKLISQFDFDIAAISCWSSLNYLSSIMVARICKNVNSKSTVVVGGYHPSALPADFMYPRSPFDFIVAGEGEIALLKICEGREKKDNKPKFIQGEPLDLKEDFVLDWQNYKYSEAYQHNYIYLSRGCPFSCTFCMEPAKRSSGWRSYSVDRAIKKIKRLIDIKNPSQISIVDACFGFDKAWRKEFLYGLIKNKIDRILWVDCRADSFDKEDIDLLSKLNFYVVLGLESASEEMLYIMRKANGPKMYLERFKDVITYMNKKQVVYEISLIFNHPGETCTTYAATIKFLRSLTSEQDKISGKFMMQNYAFFPGSHVHRHLKYYEQRHGTMVRHKEWWRKQDNHFKLATSIIPSKDLMDKNGKANYWQKEQKDLNQQCFKKMPIWTRFFLQKRAEIFKKERDLFSNDTEKNNNSLHRQTSRAASI